MFKKVQVHSKAALQIVTNMPHPLEAFGPRILGRQDRICADQEQTGRRCQEQDTPQDSLLSSHVLNLLGYP